MGRDTKAKTCKRGLAIFDLLSCLRVCRKYVFRVCGWFSSEEQDVRHVQGLIA
jgi:hypothetical protein